MRRAAVAAAVPHDGGASAAAAAAAAVPPPIIPFAPPPGMEAIVAAAQMAATVSQSVLSVMMLAMVATAVVSTVSMSAVMVQRAQEAAPTPAAQLAALLNPPTPTLRPNVARRERAPPAVQQIVEESTTRTIQWAPPAPISPPATPHTSDGNYPPMRDSPVLTLPTVPTPPLAPLPSTEPECNVTYTKTTKTITMEPTGNVTHVETSTYMIPCAEAPALPPVGAPDSEEPIVTRTTRTLPHAPSLQGGAPEPDAAAASPDGAAAADGAPAPGLDSEGLVPAPAPSMADLDPLAALLAADPTLAAQLAQLAPGEAPSGGPSRLAALLAANPALRALMPAIPGEAPPGPGGDGLNPDDTKVSYDVWGRPVSNPEAERAADAAEDAQPLATTQRSAADTAAAREAETARLRAEQRAWWDAELAKARAQTQGHAARPVDLSHKPGSKDTREAHPVEHHVAMDMAQERLFADAAVDTRFDMSDEIVNYRERVEWKQHFTIGRPARRFLREAAGASARWRGWRRMMSSLVRCVVRWLPMRWKLLHND